MRGLPAISASQVHRTRRWDVVVLGTALPGLVAAILLGRRGVRVLVLEEETASRVHPGLREPFFTTPAGAEEVLGACLRALGVPLIEQRRVAPDAVAYQVVLPDARLEIGELERTADEWAAWGFADRADAARWLRALREAGRVERAAMLSAPVVRAPRRRVRGGLRGGAPATPGRSAPPEAIRGLPDELAELPDVLRPVLAAQLRALSNLGAAGPTPEARTRLLGAPLGGGGRFEGHDIGLRPLLRRRLESVHGEFRAVRGPFRLVTAAQQPGIALTASGEVWVGRLLVLNAPRGALAACVDQDPVPDLLRAPQPTHRRLALHFTLPREALPEGMAPRVIQVGDPSRPAEGTNVVTIQVFARAGEPETADLVASSVLPVEDRDPAAREAEIEAALRELLPFCGEQLRRERAPAPLWDGDGLLADPVDGSAWPGEAELRLSTRPPVFVLERAGLAGLGTEGDLLLGWRAGDAMAAELS